MKIKFIQINHDEIFVHDNKKVNKGETIDISKERAESYIARGKAEKVKEPEPKKKPKKNESNE